MSDKLLVATRKGLFTVVRKFAGWSVSDDDFLGDNVTMVLPDPRDEAIYAALNLGHFGVKLHRKDKDSDEWEELAAPAYAQEGAEDTEDAEEGPSVSQIWILESGGPDRPGVLWAGTLPGGLFKSDDRGASWHLNQPLWDRPERDKWFGGGYDDPGIHSISVDPRDSRHVAVGVSCGGAWFTRDDGETWECNTQGMYAEYMPPERREDGSIQDPHRIVQCPAATDIFWAQHHNGVFRSTNQGVSWQELHPPPSKFGFAAIVHPQDPKTAWLVPLVEDECRVPVDGKVVVARTRDGGESFEILRNGLPQENAYDVVFRHGLDIDASGDVLAMGSTTGSLWLTEDQGDSWRTLSKHLPPIYCLRFG